MIEQQWHIDKTISVGHLMSTVVIAITLISWGNSIDKRVEHNSQANKYFNSQLMMYRSEVRSDLKDINHKLDRLIEKSLKNGAG